MYEKTTRGLSVATLTMQLGGTHWNCKPSITVCFYAHRQVG